MADILELLEDFFESIETVIDFVIDFFSDLVYVVETTGKVLIALPSFLDAFFPGLGTMLMVLFGIVVIYKIMGREG